MKDEFYISASSWHGNDAAVIKWIYHRRTTVYIVFVSSLLLIFILLKTIQNRHLIYNRCRPNSPTKLAKKEYSYTKLVNPV